MPTKHPRVSVVLTQDELDRLRLEARQGESDSNLIRHKLKFPPLKQGPPAGNQNAVKGKKRFTMPDVGGTLGVPHFENAKSTEEYMRRIRGG